jgi:hypothetical protein
MGLKLNKNLDNINLSLYSNNIKTFSGFYSDSWGVQGSQSSAVWNCLATDGEGLVIAVGNGGILNYSKDGGNSWILISGLASNTWKSIVYGNGIFVAVGEGTTNYIMYSTSNNPVLSTNWSTAVTIRNAVGTVISPAVNWQDVIYTGGTNGLFVAVANTGAGEFAFRRLIISRDGINWRIETPPFEIFSTTNSLKTIIYGNGTLVVARSAVSDSVSKIIFSNNDGNTWGVCTGDSSVDVKSTSNNWIDSVYSPKLNLFILIGNSGSQRLIYSENGVNWSNVGVSSFVNGYTWTAITWSPELELFIAIDGANNIFMTSVNGKTWTLRIGSNFNSKTISSIIWNKKHGNFIMCSSSTASVNNVFNTKPLGIDTLLQPEYYFNKTSLKEFNYRDEILKFYRNADFGIKPNININVNNTYSINTPFPNGIELNPQNGVVYGKITSLTTSTIERIITVTNNSTNEKLESNIKIEVPEGNIELTTFTYITDKTNYTSTTNSFILDRDNETVELKPIINNGNVIRPLYFRISNDVGRNQLPNGLSLDPSTGVISGKMNNSDTITIDNIDIIAFNDFDRSITVTIKLTFRSYFEASFSDVNKKEVAFSYNYTRNQLDWIPVFLGYVWKIIPIPKTVTTIEPWGWNFSFFGYLDSSYNNNHSIISTESSSKINKGSFFKGRRLIGIYVVDVHSPRPASGEEEPNIGNEIKKIPGNSYPKRRESTLYVIFEGSANISFNSITFYNGSNIAFSNLTSYTDGNYRILKRDFPFEKSVQVTTTPEWADSDGKIRPVTTTEIRDEFNSVLYQIIIKTGNINAQSFYIE